MTFEGPDRFSEVAAETFVARTCFKTGPPRAVGIELEWLLNHQGDPSRPISTADLDLAAQAADGLRHSRLSVEPGGQLELSSLPFAGPAECVSALRADLIGLRGGPRAAGLALTGLGLDPWRRPRPPGEAPRYTAMETYFDRTGPAGRAMMCSTASVQINVDAGVERSCTRAGGRGDPMATPPRPGTRPDRLLRQLPDGPGAPDGMASHPGAGLGRDGSGPNGCRAARRGGPPGVLDALRTGRTGDVRRRSTGRPGRCRTR